MGKTERSIRRLLVSLLLTLTMAMCLVVAFGAMKAWAATGKTVTIAVGQTATLNGTHSSMASSESWTSSDTSIATVAAVDSYSESNATVTGVSAGTATITHTISSLFGSSTETFTVIVTGGSSGGEENPGGGSSGGNGSGTGGNTGGGNEEPAEPAHVKSITNDGRVADEYTISLNVKGQSKTTTSTTTGETTTSPYDILLVLDNTTSMQSTYGSTTRLAAMQSAASEFVNGLPVSENSKIAMISFIVGNRQSPTTTDVDWTALSSGKSSVISAINGLTAPTVTYGYDTCFTQPLQTASSMMDDVSSDGNKRFVVFFTDGSAAETFSQIQTLAGNVKSYADATFSIGITQYAGDADKASALATSGNYYDVTSSGNMSSAFSNALQTITSQTTVTKAPMTGVTIKDTLSDYVELSNPDEENKGVTLTADPADSNVSIGSVEVSGKDVMVTLSGDLTDDTVYTVSIPVKPSEQAHREANAASDSPSKFASNASASLTYQYGSEAAKTSAYTETPRIAVAKQFTLTYDANAGEDEVTNLPEAQTAASDGKVTVSETSPTREGYTFLGWSTDSSATEADAAYSANTEVTLTADTTLYAVWQINTHTVTFNVQGHGTAPEAQTVNHNGTATRPETDPAANGYTFGGWYTDAECTNEYSFETPVTEDITVFAKWTPAEYTISYNLDGGLLADGVTNPVTYTIESDDITLSNPTKEGYTFTGWTGTDVTEASQNVTIAKGSTGNRTYTAAWEVAEASYTVRHYLQNLENDEYTEKAEDAQTLTGKIGEQTTAEAKTYEGFTMVNLVQKTIPASGSTTVPVYYDRNKHTVTYTVTGDAPSDSAAPAGGTYKYGASVSVADDPTSTQTTKGDLQGTWTFSGWTTTDVSVTDGSFTMPDRDVTFTGSWTFTETGKYSVSYIVNGDEKPSDYVEQNGPKNQYAGTVLDMPNDLTTAATANAAGVPGSWSFSGWTITSPDGLTANADGTYIMPDSDVTITGSWTFTPGTYKVIWKNEDGTVLETDTGVAYNAEPEYNGGTPTKAEDETNTYTFTGWTPETSPVTEDVTYTAVFSSVPKTVYNTVTFDSDGGSAVDPQTVAADATATEPAAPTRDGYTFKGWTLNGSSYDFSTPVTGNITLVAQWEQNQTPDPEPDPDPQPQPDPGYTIDTTQKSHTYEIYQIFTGNYTEKDGKAILTDLVWGENGKSNDEANPAVVGQPVPEEIINALKALTGGEVEPSDKKKLAEIEKYVNMSQSTNYPKTVASQNGESASITGLPAGYYLIKDKDGSQTGKDDSYTLYITQIVKDYTIQPKSVKPTVDKQVSDDDESDTTSSENATNKNPGSGWYETADHAIGETFQFRLIATLPASTHYADYSAYKLVFTDTMSDGVTFDSIASVSVNGTAVSDGGYSTTATTGQAGGSWTLTINDVKSVQSDLSNGAVVTVVYNAHLNENAIVHKAGADSTDTNKNTVSLQYSNNPNTDHGGDMGKTASDTVWVFTYEVDNTKKKNSKDGDALPGAGFRLYDSNGSEIALTYNGTKGAYLPAAAGAAGAEMKSGADGKFNIIGLDAGTYTLKETKTPDGYNKCADTTVTISASHSENNDTTTAKLDLGSSNTDNTIINNSGTALPSTGGIGTRIFYILGTILVLGAGVVLVSRRRSRDN